MGFSNCSDLAPDLDLTQWKVNKKSVLKNLVFGLKKISMPNSGHQKAWAKLFSYKD
jgi:hypothetical protein